MPVPDLGTGGDRGDPRPAAHRRPLVQRDGMRIAVPTIPGATGVDGHPITERPVRHVTGRLTHRRPRDEYAAPVAGRHHTTDVHDTLGPTEEPRSVGNAALMRPGGGRRPRPVRSRGGSGR
ncbi:hypothetical protein RB628_05665 [Streptomyces sp. ADMS]|uniref:hypothetical protein n=1 Tax=Streptomyces sp. ADMS TaxID=3071415 RepID=UPI00296EE287|nr:hypothetical protein [Streptomyces sp. ADMS]MDW4904846.1 hypothetical protein [Streptomyces sp. ADMS]